MKINIKKAKDICPQHCGSCTNSSSSSGNTIPTSPPIVRNDCTAEIASILKEREWSCERLTTDFKHKHTDQVIMRENIYVKAIDESINEKDQIYRKTENTDGLSSNYLNPNVRKTFSNTKRDIGSEQQQNLTSTPSLLKNKIVLPHHAKISRTSSTAETEVYTEESNPKGGTRLNAPSPENNIKPDGVRVD